MPYVKEEHRERLTRAVDNLADQILDEAEKELVDGGEIVNATKGLHNYAMFTLALKLAKRLGVRYSTLQDIVGTFECCKAEFLRRVVSPYEDGAIERNGDIEELKEV